MKKFYLSVLFGISALCYSLCVIGGSPVYCEPGSIVNIYDDSGNNGNTSLLCNLLKNHNVDSDYLSSLGKITSIKTENDAMDLRVNGHIFVTCKTPANIPLKWQPRADSSNDWVCVSAS